MCRNSRSILTLERSKYILAEDTKDTTSSTNISTNTEQSPDKIETTPDTDKPKTGYKEIDSLVDAKTDIIDENLFSLPEDRDFYINAVDPDWYVKIAGIAQANNKDQAVNDTQAAVYYTEDPPIMNPGYYPDKEVYIVQPTNMQRGSQDIDVFMGFQDGDTVSFSASECNCGDSETRAFIDNTAHAAAAKILGYDPTDPQGVDPAVVDAWSKEKLDTIEIRVFGIDCPEVPHLSPLSDDAMSQVSKCSLGDLQSSSGGSYVKFKCTDNTGADTRKWKFEARDPGVDTRCIHIGGTLHEVISRDDYSAIRGDMALIDGDEATQYIYVSTDSSALDKIAQGNTAARIMHKLITQATDCRVMINAGNMSTRGNSSYASPLDNGSNNNGPVWNAMKSLAEPFLGHSLFASTGFNQAGQELYGRIIAAVYLYGPYGQNDANIWINAAKYIVSKTNQTQINKSINGSVVNGALKNMAPDIFNAESYELNWALYADAMWDGLERFDDRGKVQKEIFKKHEGRLVNMGDINQFTSLTEWTCVIGDVALMVPPTSIRCITQTTTERIPLVRAKGSIAKGGEHSDRLIELHLYFNGEEGINGVPWTTDLPTAKSKQVSNPQDATITYYMNGLRALVSEFRLVPYVPIDNQYINQILNVTAVCFQSISISTVPKFPKLIQCVLTLREFSPSSFMPQIPENFSSIEFRNYFAKMINYETMRFYYQRPLILGNQLAKASQSTNTPIDITSKEFMQQTLFSNRTAMIPCNFVSPEMDFYTASESYLNSLMNVKRAMSTKSSGGSFQPRTEPQQRFMDTMAKVMKGFYEGQSDSSLTEYLSGMSGYTTVPEDMYKTAMNSMLAHINEEAPSTVSHVDYTYSDMSMTLELNTNITEDEQLKTLKDMAGAYEGGNDLSGAMEGRKIKIQLRRDGNQSWYFDRYSKDILFGTYCYDFANVKDANSEAMKKKQSMDIEDAESIKFEPYLTSVRIDAMSVQFSNTMTNVSLQNSDSIAPQYMGGTDCDIVVNLTTTSKKIATLLDRLPKYSSYLHRTYHLVLPMYPVKIDSDFTRMLGITEVSFDNVVTNTVPNYPGVYSIQLTLKSTDRTLRNREALKRVNVPGHSNEHITQHTDISKDRTKTYFDLSQTISQINLYPDLELPTIKELANFGFQFIRYKNRTMKYPDPDFYFIYPGAIFNEVVRENVFAFIKNMKDKLGHTAYKDKYGAKINMGFTGTLDYSSANQTLRGQVNVMRNQEKIELEDTKRKAEVMDEALEAAMVADPGSWDISPKIKTVFMETYYYRELMLYLNQIKLGIFKHNIKADNYDEMMNYIGNKDKTDDDDPDFQQQLANDKKAAEQGQDKNEETQIEKNRKAAQAAYNSANEELKKQSQDNKTKGDNNGKATTDPKTTGDAAKQQNTASNNKLVAKLMKLNAVAASTDSNKTDNGSTSGSNNSTDSSKDTSKQSTDTNAASTSTDTQTEDEKKAQAAQDEKISYQATKGLHLYDRLQIVRDKVKSMESILNSDPSEGIDSINDMEIMVRGLYNLYLNCFSDDNDDSIDTKNIMADLTSRASSDTYKAEIILSDLFAAALAARAGRREFNFEEYDSEHKKTAAAVGGAIGAGIGTMATPGAGTAIGGAAGAGIAVATSDYTRKQYGFGACLSNTSEIWLPDPNIVGVASNAVSQDPGGRQYITKKQYDEAKEIGGDTFNNLLDSMTEVGICRIKFYSKAGIANLIAPDPIDTDALEKKDIETYNASDPVFTLDPYYRYSPVSNIRSYKQKLIENNKFCGIIFIREFIYWLKTLYKAYVMPSVSFDIHRKEARNEAKILAELQKQIDQYNADNKNPKDVTDTNQANATAHSANATGAADSIAETNKEAAEKQNETDAAKAAHMKDQLKTGDTSTTNPTEAQTKASATKGTKNNKLQLTEMQKNMAKTIAKFLKESGYALDLGKAFAALCLVVTNGDHGLIQDMKTRNYKALNAYIKEAAHSTPEDNTQNDAKYMMRKFIMACVGTGAINKPDELGQSPQLPSQRFISDFNQRKVLETANKPEQWILHSFLDMAQSDFRGRMLRAFPTFYMILVDEGRELGFWKLHDNFYNTNAISDIKIMKSRKNPSDTCTVTLSNVFNTFTDQDEDGKYNYNYNYSDVFKSIFTPRAYAKDEEIRRKSTQEINKAKIRTGARIHLRLGYGNDASIMPLAFNGVVAQVQEGPVVQIMGQGDGIELCNQILDVDADEDVDQLMYRSNFLGNTLWEATGGQTPKTILNNLFTTTGSWLAKQVKDWNISKYFDENPYGLYHFGDRDYKDIIEDGEPTQNIYEVDKNPSWGYVAAKTNTETTTNVSGNSAENTTEVTAKQEDYNPIDKYDEIFNSDDSTSQGPPTLSFKVANKTIWDIAHICASVNPQFITSVAPFNFRSTLFFGRPRYYYAYDYKNPNNTIVEKRKPFQQYHVYFSSTDIINNQITTSTKKVKTVVTGLFKRKTPFTENCKVGPLHADYSIYPENQRSIIYDTQYIGKYQDFNRGYPGHYGKDREGSDGTFSQLAQYGFNVVRNAANNIGYTIGEIIPEGALKDKHHKVAWNMSASKLKDCMQELYQGQLLVLGDPSVKPYDRIFFNDMYRDMNGQFLVRDVTHMFSAQTGFTTAITPDCIVTVDDRDEYIVQNAGTVITCRIVQSFITYMAAKGVGSYYAKKGMAAVKEAEALATSAEKKIASSSKVKKGAEAAEKAGSKLGALSKKAIEKSSILGKLKNLKNAKGILPLIVKGGISLIGGGAAIVAAPEGIAATLLGIAVSYVVSSSLSGALYNWIRNLRVVKVFPIKRYGKPYISGLEGSHGLVYGSPSWDQEDFLGQFIGYVFAPGKGDSIGSAIANIARNLFTDEDVENAAAQFDHEADMTDEDGNPTQSEEDFESLENGLFTGNMCFEGASQKLKYCARAAVDDYDQVNKNTEKYRCKDAKNLTSDPAINSLIIVKTYPSIEPFVKNRFFRIVHDGQTFSDLSRVHDYNIKVKGQIVSVQSIEDDSGHVDLPLLSKDSCIVLSDILYKAYRLVTNGSVTNANDNAQTKKDTNGQFVVLKKAYTIGDDNLYVSSGFAFIIEPHGSPLVSKFKSVMDEIMNNANGTNASGKDVAVMQYQYDGGEYEVVVTPPNQ